MKSPHVVLGVAPNASKEEIKSAYRKLVKQYHPDKTKDDPDATKRFHEIQAAYDDLTDETKKNAKPTAHAPWSGFPGGHPFSGFDFAGGQANFQFRQTARIQCDISVVDAYNGCKVSLDIQTPDGRNPTIFVDIPAGIPSGSTLRVNTDDPSLTNIDLMVIVMVIPSDRFAVNGADLFTKVELSVWDALLGGSFNIPTIDGDVDVVIPPAINHGATIVVPAKGMPLMRQEGVHGALNVIVEVVMPTLTDAQRDAVRRIRDGDAE